jgi:hypothetical protein
MISQRFGTKNGGCDFFGDWTWFSIFFKNNDLSWNPYHYGGPWPKAVYKKGPLHCMPSPRGTPTWVDDVMSVAACVSLLEPTWHCYLPLKVMHYDYVSMVYIDQHHEKKLSPRPRQQRGLNPCWRCRSEEQHSPSNPSCTCTRSLRCWREHRLDSSKPEKKNLKMRRHHCLTNVIRGVTSWFQRDNMKEHLPIIIVFCVWWQHLWWSNVA